ncbi:MAG: acetyltransferase [Bacteroidota bacterium]
MIQDVAIYGAGGFGRETVLLLDQINQEKKRWNLVGFFDDGMHQQNVVDNIPVLGGLQQLNDHARPIAVIFAIADPLIRRRVVRSVKNSGVTFPSVIHPQSIVDLKRNRLGNGAIVTAGNIFTLNISIGDFVIVNLLNSIGHDTVIGNYCTVMPGCSLSGNVVIGEATMIGTGARILQNLTIGKMCKVGAGAVVTKDFSDEVTIVGVPAVELK